MTPDMKRLCDEAAFAFNDVTDLDVSLSPNEAKAIVRAVLLALREPSRETLMQSCHYGEDLARSDLQAMIDHILADPVKA